MCSVGEYLRICSRKAHYTFNNNASASHVATHHPQIELNQCHTHSKYRAATSSTIYLSSWWVGRRQPPTNRCLNKPTLHRDVSQPASQPARQQGLEIGTPLVDSNIIIIISSSSRSSTGIGTSSRRGRTTAVEQWDLTGMEATHKGLSNNNKHGNPKITSLRVNSG